MGKKTNGAAKPKMPPKHVAIVALGPSSRHYIQLVESHGGRSAFADQVWTVNSYGNVIDHDLLFHMDDVRIQEIRAKAGHKKIANMLSWMKTHDKPILTSRAHPDYPALVEFPLQDVVNSCGAAYFNNTVPYAIAYAIYSGVEQISLFGLDYTYAHSHDAETGRACCEYWLGRASQKGILVNVSAHSSLLDANVAPADSWYGYDTLDVTSAQLDTGKVAISFTPKPKLPTAQDIERRYDHSRPLNHYKSRGKATGLFAGHALRRLLEYKDAQKILDIGSGKGQHAKIMRDHKRDVTTISMIPPADFIGDYLAYKPEEKFDAIWASHILEHTPYPHDFLKKMRDDLRDDGVLAITVPPMRSELVGGHLTLWTPGLLLYHLVLAGWDCTEARVSPCYPNEGPDQVPYNLSVIVRKKPDIKLPDLVHDAGDIERLRGFFPCPVGHEIDGRLKPINWDVKPQDDRLWRDVKVPEKKKPAPPQEEARA